ncbi:MAG: peroxiredoxin [Planctomycetota bacterium]
MSPIEVGSSAPDLTLSTHTGEQISLSDYRGEKTVVVFFYPKDGMPVCTKEACYFRDAYEDFVDAGAVVIGISSDSAERHQRFAASHNLPFILASDPDGAARRAFGVPKSMGVFPGRVTYVIDQEGVVRHMFSSQMGASRHVEEALEAIRKLDA